MRKLLLSLVLFVASISAAMAQDLFTGDWIANETSDVSCSLQLNVEKPNSFNPYDESVKCSGFLTVNVVEPSGNSSILVTYELMTKDVSKNKVVFTFTGGREADDVSGECAATIENGKLVFKGIGAAKNEVINGLSFTKLDEPFVAETTIGTSSDKSEKSTLNKVMDIISKIVSICVVLFIVGHMVYVNYRGKRYKMVFTVKDFEEKRALAGTSKEMSEQEAQEAFELMEKAFNTWTVVERTKDDEFHRPTKMKQVKASVLLIDQVIAMMPTDEDIVERLNVLTEVINSAEERHFDGSKKLIWLGAIVGILMFWMIGIGMCLSTLCATGVYVLASRTPQFLIDKRAARGGGNIHNGIFAGLFAMLAGAQTVRTIYKFNDGSKAYEDDHSQTWIALAIGFAVMVVLAMMMSFWAFLNYIRNYVLFF